MGASVRDIYRRPGARLRLGAGGRSEGNAEWTYRFRPVEEGTEVEESWRILRMAERLIDLGDEVLMQLKANTESSIEATLAKLKKVAESET